MADRSRLDAIVNTWILARFIWYPLLWPARAGPPERATIRGPRPESR
jgi:hypothetical protein